MEYELRVIVEKVAVSSQEVVQRETITTYEITAPASILDLVHLHRSACAFCWERHAPAWL